MTSYSMSKRPPKRVQPASSSQSSSSKRRRTVDSAVIGAPSDADLPSARINAPSSSSCSIRTIDDEVPSLSSLCIRSFVAGIRTIVEEDWNVQRTYIQVLPEYQLSQLFRAMKSACPLRMSHAVVHSHFFRTTTLSLSSQLPITKQTISCISEIGQNLRELELCDFEKYADELFALIFPKLPSLRRLNLRGCTKVGPKTVQAVAANCLDLISSNWNYTSVTPLSIASLLKGCLELQVLKLAGVTNWTDATFNKLLQEMGKDFQLPNLESLKLRQTAMTEHSISSLVLACPNLKRLDVSFTSLRRLLFAELPIVMPPLEKLSLKSIQAPLTDILALLSHLLNLRTLSLGALGGGSGTSSLISNSSAMTLSDDGLASLTAVLETMPHLESVDLVGNSKLGLTSRKANSALANFIRIIGRRCKTLNMGGIPSLSSTDLIGLLPDEEDPFPPLQTLILSNTNVGDEAAPYIACCMALTSLDCVGTKFSSEGLFLIVDSCCKLQKLDLTSCRGVKVADRRRFFEVWREQREHM